METVQIRLPRDQLKRIDRDVRAGRYKSRSEAVRDYLNRLDLLSTFSDFQQLAEDENVSKRELLEAVKEERRNIYRKYLG